MKRFILFLLMSLLASPQSIFALDCSQLRTSEEIRQHMLQAKETIPVHRSEISVRLNVSPCERQECSKENIAQRKNKASEIHIVRKDQYSRSFFVDGRNYPVCLINKSKRKFRCSECNYKYSSQCRTYSTSTSIDGTNLDSEDLYSLGSDDFKYSCQTLKKIPSYFKIVGDKLKGDSPYDQVQEFFEKKRGLLVKIDYYKAGILRKTYRIYPKQYVKIKDKWIATKIRVRTTEGKESRYIFETVLIASKEKGKFMIFLDPTKDPLLKNTVMDDLFITN